MLLFLTCSNISQAMLLHEIGGMNEYVCMYVCMYACIFFAGHHSGKKIVCHAYFQLRNKYFYLCQVGRM